MPYIAIKSYPKDEEVKKRLVERINQDIQEILGSPESAITISYEEVLPENWKEEVVEAEVNKRMDSVYILSGNKQF